MSHYLPTCLPCSCTVVLTEFPQGFLRIYRKLPCSCAEAFKTIGLCALVMVVLGTCRNRPVSMQSGVKLWVWVFVTVVFVTGTDLRLLPCTSKAIMPFCLQLMLACFKVRSHRCFPGSQGGPSGDPKTPGVWGDNPFFTLLLYSLQSPNFPIWISSVPSLTTEMTSPWVMWSFFCNMIGRRVRHCSSKRWIRSVSKAASNMKTFSTTSPVSFYLMASHTLLVKNSLESLDWTLNKVMFAPPFHCALFLTYLCRHRHAGGVCLPANHGRGQSSARAAAQSGHAHQVRSLPRMHAHRHTYAHIHTHTHVHTHTHTHTHLHAHTHTSIHTHACSYKHTHTHMHARTKTHAHPHSSQSLVLEERGNIVERIALSSRVEYLGTAG